MTNVLIFNGNQTTLLVSGYRSANVTNDFHLLKSEQTTIISVLANCVMKQRKARVHASVSDD